MSDIVVVDPLYGAIIIPEWLRPVLLSPELQRLRQVRLINTASPFCSALSDVRRFTHTLGVLHLASTLEKKIQGKLSREEARAFLIASLLHDIGTPAFGHLFEYQLTAMKGWHHEHIVSDIIKGTYRPEKRYHQIYASRTLRLHAVLKELGIDTGLVISFVRGESLIGKALAGSIDLDNIDSVFRMAVHLGLRPDTSIPERLVNTFELEASGLLFEEEVLPLLETWQRLRRQSYEYLAFDEACLGGQAMLTDCLTMALSRNLLLEEHWHFTDEDLLRHLSQFEETKESIQRFMIGDFYQQVFLAWYDRGKGDVDLRHPDNRTELAERMKDKIGIPCSPYVFYDSGTFSKNLNVVIKTSTQEPRPISLSSKSESTIVAVFTPRRVTHSEKKRVSGAVAEILELYGFDSSQLKAIPNKHSIYEFPSQRTIPFGT